jgi:hypothetical protein
LVPLVAENKPVTVRGTFYLCETRGWVEKTEAAVALIQRRLLRLRRQRVIPYPWIVDESRDVYGHTSYSGLDDLAADAARLYRRDYWRRSGLWVQVWLEKRALAGVLAPVVVGKWGLNLYVCGGQPSETYLYRAGLDIANRGVETHVYVLSDFDPAGSVIFDTLAKGTKKAPGGLSRFTDGVPVHVHKLALTAEQVREWGLPTRPAKKSDKRSAKFVEEHGDVSVELDAVPPNDLRRLVDEAIAQHMAESTLEAFKAIEAEEQQMARILLEDAGVEEEDSDDAAF